MIISDGRKIKVYNGTVDTIPANRIVIVKGKNIVLASNSDADCFSYPLAYTLTSIDVASYGEVLLEGSILNLNTSGYGVGNVVIYVGTNGALTTSPSGIRIIVANLIKSDSINGELYFKVFLPASAEWGSITGTLSDQTDLQNALDDKVPYTGAIDNVDLGEFQLKTGQVEFDQTPTGSFAVAKMRWNDTDGVPEIRLKGGNVTGQMFLENLKRVVNKTGGDLLEANYQVVRIRTVGEGGAVGQRLAVKLAMADSDANSATTLGVVTETILNNQEGFINIGGEVKEIDTTGTLQGETWNDGDVLYLSGTVAGQLTNIKPTAPTHTIIVGFVSYKHAVHGKIDVKVDNGYELDELHNVAITTPANNDLLTYESSTSLWKNKQLTSSIVTTALGYTPYNSTNPNGYITSSALSPYLTSAIAASTYQPIGSYQSALSGTGFVKISGTTISYDNTSYYPASNPANFAGGTVTSVAALTLGTSGTNLSSSVANGTTTPVITLNVPTASASNRGALSSTDWSTFNNKQNAITLTTTGTSGAATLVGSTLNIPQYSGGSSSSVSFQTIVGSATGLAAATTRYSNVAGTTSESQNRVPIPVACTMSDLYVRTTATMGATASLAVTIFKNGLATTVTLLIAGGSAAGTYSYTATTASFAAGDGFNIEYKNVGAAAAAASSGTGYKVTI